MTSRWQPMDGNKGNCTAFEMFCLMCKINHWRHIEMFLLITLKGLLYSHQRNLLAEIICFPEIIRNVIFQTKSSNKLSVSTNSNVQPALWKCNSLLCREYALGSLWEKIKGLSTHGPEFDKWVTYLTNKYPFLTKKCTKWVSNLLM